MYFFAIDSTLSHTSLYLIQVEPNKEPRLWSVNQSGQRIYMREWSPTYLGSEYWVGEYNGDPTDIEKTKNNYTKGDCINISSLLYQALFIRSDEQEVSRLRDFIAYTKQFSSVLVQSISQVGISGAAPYYNGSGKNRRNQLSIEPVRETFGEDPVDIRGVRATFTDMCGTCGIETHYDWLKYKSRFSKPKKGHIRLARTNCVTFATTVLSKYCGVDINSIQTGLCDILDSFEFALRINELKKESVSVVNIQKGCSFFMLDEKKYIFVGSNMDCLKTLNIFSSLPEKRRYRDFQKTFFNRNPS